MRGSVESLCSCTGAEGCVGFQWVAGEGPGTWGRAGLGKALRLKQEGVLSTNG